MRKRIKTYEDLLEEEQRLQALAESYKLLIKGDLSGIKEGLNPVKKAAKTVKNMFTMENNGPLINFWLNFIMEVVMRKVFLAKAGWVTKLLVPFVVKNYTSHIIGDEDKSKFVRGIRRLLKSVLPKKVRKEAEAIVTA